jgi:hypothetical protein
VEFESRNPAARVAAQRETSRCLRFNGWPFLSSLRPHEVPSRASPAAAEVLRERVYGKKVSVAGFFKSCGLPARTKNLGKKLHVGKCLHHFPRTLKDCLWRFESCDRSPLPTSLHNFGSTAKTVYGRSQRGSDGGFESDRQSKRSSGQLLLVVHTVIITVDL